MTEKPVIDTTPDEMEIARTELIRSKPLKERITVEGELPFIPVDAARAGIDFVASWEPAPERRREILNGMVGGGVCLGDVDGDGLTDVFLTRPSGGPRLYRNLGDFKFEDITERAGLAGDPTWRCVL
ncbi:MAG: VCBS repeat-containing protein [Verrucomicrobiota bacterium]